MNEKKKVWYPISIQSGTVFNGISEGLSSMDSKYSNILPNLRDENTLMMGCDYSGEDKKSQYMVYTFFLTTWSSLSQWELKRLEFRKRFFSDRRRISFKKFNDNQRSEATIPFLQEMNSINGLVFSVVYNKKCPSLFETPPLDLSNSEFASFKKWKPKVLAKAFLILHLSNILLAGLARPFQNVFWFTDEDSIVANDQRVVDLTKLFGWISDYYFTYPMGHIRCGTSRCDDGSLQIEDFLAVPDLISGALAEQYNKRISLQIDIDNAFLLYASEYSKKTKDIIWWFSSAEYPLKRVFCVLEPGKDNGGHLLSWFHFHNQC